MIDVPVGKVQTSTCGLTFLRIARPVGLEAGHVDLVVEVADVAQDRLVLHPRHLVDGDDVLVAGRGDDDVGDAEDVVEGGDLVAVHRRLQRADRVDLGDDHPGALAAQRLRAALADVAVAADDRDLAADEDVGGAVDAVDERVAAAVLVVELRLGDRVVDVDGREEQRALLHHVVEAVHAGGGLLGDALDLAGDLGPAVAALGERGVWSTSKMTFCSWLVAVAGSGATPVFSTSTPRWTSRVASPPSSRIMLANVAGGPLQDLLGAPPVLLQRLALPGEDRDAGGGVDGAGRADRDGGGRVVLGGEDVAGGPAHLGAERDQRLDEHRGLDRHVQRAGDPGAGQRLARRRSARASP